MSLMFLVSNNLNNKDVVLSDHNDNQVMKTTQSRAKILLSTKGLKETLVKQ